MKHIKTRYVWLVDYKIPKNEYWDSKVFKSKADAIGFQDSLYRKYMTLKFTTPIKRKIH